MPHGTRVTIELEGRYQRGRGSVDDYLEQTAIANPHVTLHYLDPEGNQRTYPRSTDQLPPEPKEIKPHPYGIELGRLVTMLKDTKATTAVAVPHDFVFARQRLRGPADLRGGQTQPAGIGIAGSGGAKPIRCTRPSSARRSAPRRPTAFRRSARSCC